MISRLLSRLVLHLL
uniref:Uncharacterized protein n=1 Tax=Anguilla anguilla TaxID=7936 RepID=A0A0E9UET3_ANGAN